MSEKKTGANKIIEGLKQAAQHAVCEHDWEAESSTVWQGQITTVRVCQFCKARETVRCHST